MTKEKLTIKVPGKLMVAGEFAVLEQNQPLVVIAVNRFVYVDAVLSKKNKLTLASFQLENLNWSYQNGEVKIETKNPHVSFVKQAMEYTLNYLETCGIKPTPFTLSVTSELDDRPGVKYGLGSSAAVVVGVVTAILAQFLPEQAEKRIIYKLAALTHFAVQGNGSCADIAASTYGGTVAYHAFDGEWLKEQIAKGTAVEKIIKAAWPCLKIEPVKIPAQIELCIGWTGSPASTYHLVQNIKQLKGTNEAKYNAFLMASKEAVELFLQGLKTNDTAHILKGVKQNRQALIDLGTHAKTAIETPLLSKLAIAAENLGGAGKSSGAGGGDCGIGFVTSAEKAAELKAAWQKIGILPLEIKIYPNGAGRE